MTSSVPAFFARQACPQEVRVCKAKESEEVPQTRKTHGIVRQTTRVISRYAKRIHHPSRTQC